MATERWNVDSSHSGLYFSVRHLVVARVRGRFARWTATIQVPEGDLARADVDALIDVSTVETGAADRDAHLRSADFFDAARFPFATFRSTRFEPGRDGGGRLTGTLTIRDVAREVEVEVRRLGHVTDPWRNDRAAFVASASIDPTAFGLRWNQALEAGGVLVGDQVDLEIEVEAVRQQGGLQSSVSL